MIKIRMLIVCLFALFLLNTDLLISCMERHEHPDPYDASRITGNWITLTGALPDWEYRFSGSGFMEQRMEVGNTLLASQEYTYSTRKDTVFIGGGSGPNQPARAWKVYFYCDSIVEVDNVSSGVVLGGRFWLKQVK